MRGRGELRVKESDRLAAIATGLDACGVRVAVDADSLTVHGSGGGAGSVPGGGTVDTHYDHRIAMSFLLLGLAAANPVTVDDARALATTFPGFVPLMTGLGAPLGATDPA